MGVSKANTEFIRLIRVLRKISINRDIRRALLIVLIQITKAIQIMRHWRVYNCRMINFSSEIITACPLMIIS